MFIFSSLMSSSMGIIVSVYLFIENLRCWFFHSLIEIQFYPLSIAKRPTDTQQYTSGAPAGWCVRCQRALIRFRMSQGLNKHHRRGGECTRLASSASHKMPDQWSYLIHSEKVTKLYCTQWKQKKSNQFRKRVNTEQIKNAPSTSIYFSVMSYSKNFQTICLSVPSPARERWCMMTSGDGRKWKCTKKQSHKCKRCTDGRQSD